MLCLRLIYLTIHIIKLIAGERTPRGAYCIIIHVRCRSITLNRECGFLFLSGSGFYYCRGPRARCPVHQKILRIQHFSFAHSWRRLFTSPRVQSISLSLSFWPARCVGRSESILACSPALIQKIARILKYTFELVCMQIRKSIE